MYGLYLLVQVNITNGRFQNGILAINTWHLGARYLLGHREAMAH